MVGSTWIDSINAAYPAMARLYDAHEANRAAADQGYFVCSGADVVASGTAGKLKVNTGTIFSSTTEVNITSAIDNIACAVNADSTNPRWGILEIDNTTTPGTPTANLNLNTALAAPIMPSLTAGRSAHAWIYIPANATVVDALTSNPNGNIKIIDARQLRTVHVTRDLYVDAAVVSLSNPFSQLTSVITAAPTIPANSLNTGDVLEVEVFGTYANTSTSTALQIEALMGSTILWNYTTPSLTLQATNTRSWTLRLVIAMQSVGSSAQPVVGGHFYITQAANAINVVTQFSSGAGTSGDGADASRPSNATFNSTTGQVLDVQVKLGATSSGGTIKGASTIIRKSPA